MTLSTQDHIVTEATTAYSGPNAALDLEVLLTTTWGEALGQDSVSPDDDFFDLGGNSLVVLELRRRLAAEGIDLAMPDVYRYPNVRALAWHLAA